MKALLGRVPRPSKAAVNDRTVTLPAPCLKRPIDWVDTFRSSAAGRWSARYRSAGWPTMMRSAVRQPVKGAAHSITDRRSSLINKMLEPHRSVDAGGCRSANKCRPAPVTAPHPPAVGQFPWIGFRLVGKWSQRTTERSLQGNAATDCIRRTTSAEKRPRINCGPFATPPGANGHKTMTMIGLNNRSTQWTVE
jgi:hypothetical protein